ncbi:MAG TPA: HAMP domain-containing sensor histidine kinase [Stellaceae bacterium]|jgi:two-component system cell cycle sensor histidine kinase PleC|nr:HAMP domain-containing sensor histidine kinase [Stellaceae bacterium]
MNASRRHHKSLLDDYCNQLGMLLERRYTERVLVAAKEQAENAAMLAKQAMQQAQAADRAKSQFLATMTHELRTPLNAIIGFSEVLKDAPRQSSDIPTYASYIHESGTQLLGMLNGVLDLARIEAGRLELDEQEVRLEEVLDAAIRPLRKTAEEKSVSIMVGMVVERALMLDPGKMTQVFSNLLSNSINFTPEGGSIEIDSDLTEAGELSILLRDSGKGIPPEDLERVLEPFGQVEDHLTRQNGGVGLGLPIARALVRLHGGDLKLTSEVDVGTSIDVRLPSERVRPPAAASVA